MKVFMEARIQVVMCLILGVLLLSSCSAFRNLAGEAGIRRPEVEFAGVELTGLSFDAADLVFDLRIRNPNPVGLKMAGFDYDFLIDGSSFLKGNQEKGLEIESRGENVVKLPLSLNYVDLYRTFQSLSDQDVSMYQLECDFEFDVPVLGIVRIPVSKEGELPLLKLPRVGLGELRLKSLSLSGAELQLQVQMSNPNAFSMILKSLDYQFQVNGQDWASGIARENAEISEKGEGIIELPIYLDFLQMGRSVYQLLSGDRDLSYSFGGKIDLATSLPILEQVSLPFDRSGSIKVIR